MTTHLFFDFFGTLVDYSASRTEQGFDRSFALLRESGTALAYEDFLEQWSGVSAEFDAEAARTLREFSMVELSRAFLRRALPSAPPDALVGRFAETYVEEWNKGVFPIAGVPELISRLAGRFRLAVITNTHDPSLVPAHLARIGIADHFERVVTSIEHGFRKPHRAIFDHALLEMGASRDGSIHIGDDLEADYRGALGAGLRPLLVDPARAAPVPDAARIASVLDLEARFG